MKEKYRKGLFPHTNYEQKDEWPLWIRNLKTIVIKIKI